MGAPRLPSVDEVNRSAKNAANRILLKFFAIMAAFGLWLMVGFTTASWLDYWLWSDTTASASSFVIAVGALSAVGAALFWIDRTHREFPHLSCIYCDKNLYVHRHIVIATGNCPHCGRRVIEDAKHGT